MFAKAATELCESVLISLAIELDTILDPRLRRLGKGRLSEESDVARHDFAFNGPFADIFFQGRPPGPRRM